jgi:hypothetical protein
LLVLLHFYSLGYTPFMLAFLFLLYEAAGIFANLGGGWLAARFGIPRMLMTGLALQIAGLLLLSGLDAARFGEEFAEGLRGLRLAERARQAQSDAEKHDGEGGSHQPERAAETHCLQQKAADEKAGALHRVLRAREPRDPFEQLTGATFRSRLAIPHGARRCLSPGWSPPRASPALPRTSPRPRRNPQSGVRPPRLE